jgi:hypothetical protein
VDCILLGQRVPTRLLSETEPLERWHARKAAADTLVARGLPQADALAAYAEDPRLNDELLLSTQSWAGPAAARVRLGQSNLAAANLQP